MSVDFNASFSGSAETFGAKMTETPASMTASMKETGGGSASKVWTVAHNLGKRPAVTVVDSAGTVVIGEVDYLDDNTVRLTFCAAFSGTAYFN